MGLIIFRASQVALVVKNPPTNAGDLRDMRSIPGLGGSPGGGHGNPLQYSCLENPMDRGAWWATVHRVAKSWQWLKQLSRHARGSSKWKLTVVAVQLCPTLCNPMDYSPPGSSVHGILQTRIVGWVAMPSSRGPSQPRDQTQVSRFAGRFFTTEPPGKTNWDL